MISGAVWYLQQWDEFHAPYYGDYRESMSEKKSAVVPFYAFATLAVPAVGIGISPYAYLFSKGHQLSGIADDAAYDLARNRHIFQHAPFSKIAPMRGAASRVLASKWLFARAGARLVPGLGWALLAYDLYNVGKWYIESDF
jgi:hypothetical protein